MPLPASIIYLWAAGMKSILVKTGKYRPELVKKSSVKPDAVVDSISELFNII